MVIGEMTHETLCIWNQPFFTAFTIWAGDLAPAIIVMAEMYTVQKYI
jgi:hypothetical protein